MAIIKFSVWKRAVFRCGKKIKGLRGGVVLYTAQVSSQIDAATPEKDRFRMKTNSAPAKPGGFHTIAIVQFQRDQFGPVLANNHAFFACLFFNQPIRRKNGLYGITAFVNSDVRSIAIVKT